MPSKKGTERSNSSREQTNFTKNTSFLHPVHHLILLSHVHNFLLQPKEKRHHNFQVPNIIQISNMDFNVPHSLTLLKHLLSKPPYLKQWHIEWEKISIRVSPHTIYHFKTSSLHRFPNSKEVLLMKRSYHFLKAFQIPTSHPPLHMQDLQPPSSSPYFFIIICFQNIFPSNAYPNSTYPKEAY